MRRVWGVVVVVITAWLVAGVAWAQQVMEFKPISADSISSISVGPGVVRMKTKDGRTVIVKGTTQVETPPDNPDAPEPPEPPEPLPPHVISGDRSHDMVRFGGSIHVRPDEVVTGNVVVMGGEVTIEGQVQGDVVCLGGPVTLERSARVEGDVVAIGGEVHRRPGAQIGGQVVTAAHVPGAVFSLPFLGIMGFVGKAVQAATALLLMVLLMAFAWAIVTWLPERTAEAVSATRERTAQAFGIGLAMWMLIIPSVIALVLVIVILCITIIGIPLALLALLGYGLGVIGLLLWGYVVGCAALGAKVADKLKRPVNTMVQAALWGVGVIGVLISTGKLVSGLGLLGIVGGALVFFTSVMAVGALTIGAGAILITQVGSGQPARWWSQWRSGRGSAAAGPMSGPVAAPAGAPGGSIPGAHEPGPPGASSGA